MKVTSLHSNIEPGHESIGVTVVELDHDEAKRYKTSQEYKSELMALAGNAMEAAHTRGIIIEEFQSQDFLDILTPGDFHK